MQQAAFHAGIGEARSLITNTHMHKDAAGFQVAVLNGTLPMAHRRCRELPVRRRCATKPRKAGDPDRWNHTMRAALLVAGLLISTPSIADSISCAGANVQIDIGKSVQFPDTAEAILTASIGDRSTVLRYDGNVDFIGAECRKTNRGKPLIVFQAFCGGSGCKDLDNFGIIDPKDLRVLLVPNDSNRSVAKQVFGAEVAPIANPLSVGRAYEKLFPQ